MPYYCRVFEQMAVVRHLVAAYEQTELYKRRRHRRRLYGMPAPRLVMPLHIVRDRRRFGPMGRYISKSRRIPGWTRDGEAIALAEASYGLADDAVLVEIGSFLGCSAVLLAGARKLRGSGRLHCVDAFDSSGDAFSSPVYEEIRRANEEPLLERFQHNLRWAGVQDWVVVHQGHSSDVATTWSEAIDLLFMDGDQSYEGAHETYAHWSPFLKPGGLLVVHNSSRGYRRENHDGSARLVEEVVVPPHFEDVRCVDSMTLARRANG